MDGPNRGTPDVGSIFTQSENIVHNIAGHSSMQGLHLSQFQHHQHGYSIARNEHNLCQITVKPSSLL